MFGCVPPGPGVGRSLLSAAQRQWAGRGEAVPQQERRSGADGGKGEGEKDAV